MKDRKLNLISLDRTSPFYPPPKEIYKAATQALKKYNFTNYIQTRGILELQTALVNKLHLINNINVKHEQILITVGSSIAILLALKRTAPFDISRAKNLLGYKPKFDIRKGLQDYLRIFEKYKNIDK